MWGVGGEMFLGLTSGLTLTLCGSWQTNDHRWVRLHLVGYQLRQNWWLYCKYFLCALILTLNARKVSPVILDPLMMMKLMCDRIGMPPWWGQCDSRSEKKGYVEYTSAFSSAAICFWKDGSVLTHLTGAVFISALFKKSCGWSSTCLQTVSIIRQNFRDGGYLVISFHSTATNILFSWQIWTLGPPRVQICQQNKKFCSKTKSWWHKLVNKLLKYPQGFWDGSMGSLTVYSLFVTGEWDTCDKDHRDCPCQWRASRGSFYHRGCSLLDPQPQEDW